MWLHHAAHVYGSDIQEQKKKKKKTFCRKCEEKLELCDFKWCKLRVKRWNLLTSVAASSDNEPAARERFIFFHISKSEIKVLSNINVGSFKPILMDQPIANNYFPLNSSSVSRGFQLPDVALAL